MTEEYLWGANDLGKLKGRGATTQEALELVRVDLDSQIEYLDSKADKLDYLIAIASGMLCSMMDILWVGDFALNSGRQLAADQVDDFVFKTAQMLNLKNVKDLPSAVKALEARFPLASDSATSQFGGGLQHHLRDFAHHPTIVGLAFSLLTQFTGKAYGTNTEGIFINVELDKSKAVIGVDIPQKIFLGTIGWFFHLVSDMAGSSSTAGKSGGTGIPGPILSLAKELSSLPFFANFQVHDEMTLSTIISKFYNGTIFMERDDQGKLIQDTKIPFDLRGELGLGIELGKQALPVIANDCFVRAFYSIRRLGMELKRVEVASLEDLQRLEWNKIKPVNNPRMARMLTGSTGVFTTIDLGQALLVKKKWLSVNFLGVARFAMALSSDVLWALKMRNQKKVRQIYESSNGEALDFVDALVTINVTDKMEQPVNCFSLTLSQTELLLNIYYYKTWNDIFVTKSPIPGQAVIDTKLAWLSEWKKSISQGYEDFTQVAGAVIKWDTLDGIKERLSKENPQEPWYRILLLQAMLFEPYYPLGIETDKKGKQIASTKYKLLSLPLNGYNQGEGDRFLNENFTGTYCQEGYITRLRESYNKRANEVKQLGKEVVKTGAIGIGAAVLSLATAGAFTGPIAVALVGSNFASLSGAALTSASLAYLGGGAIAAGGAGMAGGTVAILGGSAAIGTLLGAGAGSAVSWAGLTGKKKAIQDSAKYLTAVREIYLNDEKDIAYAEELYDQYKHSISLIEKDLVDERLKRDEATGKDKTTLKKMISNAEETLDIMKIALKNMQRFTSSFEQGLSFSGIDLDEWDWEEEEKL